MLILSKSTTGIVEEQKLHGLSRFTISISRNRKSPTGNTCFRHNFKSCSERACCNAVIRIFLCIVFIVVPIEHCSLISHCALDIHLDSFRLMPLSMPSFMCKGHRSRHRLNLPASIACTGFSGGIDGFITD